MSRATFDHEQASPVERRRWEEERLADKALLNEYVQWRNRRRLNQRIEDFLLFEHSNTLVKEHSGSMFGWMFWEAEGDANDG